MKKLLTIFILISILISSLMPVASARGPVLNARSAVLMDGTTGEILFSDNAEQKLPIASTTKIMTAIIVLENTDLKGNVKISKAIEDIGQSEIDLRRNERINARELLEAMMVHSANDAAFALAKYTSGDVKQFAKLMTAKAKAIGAKNTNFSNPDGLDSNNNYSTAKDLAIIAKYAMKKPLFRKIVAMKTDTVEGKKGAIFETRNKLLLRYKPAIGIKTGYTKPAGFCLVSAAEKDGAYLIGVTLNSPALDDSFANAETLLEYGYNNIEYKPVTKKGRAFKMANVPYYDKKMPMIASASSGFFKTSKNKITYETALSNESFYPIKKGDVCGSVIILKDGREVDRIKLYAGRGFEAPGLWHKITFTVSKVLNTVNGFFQRLSFE